jgi:hypothetical protein
MKKRIDSRRRQRVSTVKQSQATMDSREYLRNEHQVLRPRWGVGGSRCSQRSFASADCAPLPPERGGQLHDYHLTA